MDPNQFYKKLFTQSSKYKNASLNSDEQLRWSRIQEYLHFAEGYFFNKKESRPEILEVGCGRGWLSSRLQKYGNVLGIEPIEPVVEYAHQLFPDCNIIHGYSDDLVKEGQKEKYDLIVSSEVIEHVPDEMKDNFVKNIDILLKPGGLVIITTPREEIEAQYRKYSKPNQPVEDWISEENLKSLFGKYHMKPIKHGRLTFRPRNRYHPFAPPIEVYQTWLFQKEK